MFRGAPIKLDELAPTDSVPKEVQLLRVGKFFSQEYGDIEITKPVLLSMLKNYKDKVRGVDLAVDYKHESEDIAAGWITDVFMKNDDTELWALVDWTQNGQRVLLDKEFRYMSAEFDFDYQSNENNKKFGPTLFGAGLTNRPFIKNMKPVVSLTETEGKNKMDEKDKKIEELLAKIAELEKTIEEYKHPKSPLPVSENPNNSDMTIEAMKAEMDEMKKKLKEYEEKEKKLQDEKKLAEKTNAFNKLLSEGKAVEAQRQAFLAGDTIKFAENARPLNLGGFGSSGDAPPNSENVQDQIMSMAKQALNEKKVKTLSEGIVKVLTENADLRKQYEAR